MVKRVVIIFAVILFGVAASYLTLSVAKLGVDEPTNAQPIEIVEGFADSDIMITQLVINVFIVVSVGGVTLIFVLPRFASKVAEFTYDQSFQKFVAPNKLDAGRSLILQGEFELAIEKYREFIEETELQDRLAWVGIAQIQLDEFDDRKAAIATLREGWERENAHWNMEDDINFMTRLAELYAAESDGLNSAVEMHRILIKRYPQNDYQVRRARNALQDLGSDYSAESDESNSSGDKEPAGPGDEESSRERGNLPVQS
jgi:tetratricopeptide (TPR) repeat protein